jgi:hemerythrin
MWKPEYAVGYADIDQQHKQLYFLADELHGALAAGAAKQSVPRLLDGLIDYTCKHFADEERIMRANGYPEYAQHCRLHEDLKRQVLDLRSRMASQRVMVTIEVMQFLSDWLRHHIQIEDRKIAAHLKAPALARY